MGTMVQTLAQRLSARSEEAGRHRPFPQSLVLQLAALVLVVLFAGPLLWLLSSSLIDPSEVYVYPPQAFPHALQFENYAKVFRRVPFANWGQNSMIVATFALVGQVLSCGATAYGFAKFRFPGRDALFLLVLSTIMLPGEVTII